MILEEYENVTVLKERNNLETIKLGIRELPITISDYQFIKYSEAREKERKLEKMNKNDKTVAVYDTILNNTKKANYFKVMSRNALLFVFPPILERLWPKDISERIKANTKFIEEEYDKNVSSKKKVDIDSDSSDSDSSSSDSSSSDSDSSSSDSDSSSSSSDSDSSSSSDSDSDDDDQITLKKILQKQKQSKIKKKKKEGYKNNIKEILDDLNKNILITIIIKISKKTKGETKSKIKIYTSDLDETETIEKLVNKKLKIQMQLNQH